MPARSSNPLDRTQPAPFPTTNWTLVERVQGGNDPDALRALEEVCGQYWYPIYAFARRTGFSPPDAQDLTQVFFQRLIASDTIKAARRDKGRLRSFLLGLLKRVIANHLRGRAAEKRGGSAAATVPIEEAAAEKRYARDLTDPRDPEALFDRAWAEEILAAAEAKLREEFAIADNLERYAQLREFLPLGENATPYAEVARRLGIGEGSLRLQIHRMRKRYARVLENEILQTVSSPAEAKAELEHLLAVIAR